MYLVGRLSIMTCSIVGNSAPLTEVEHFHRLSQSEGEEQRGLAVQLDSLQQGSLLATVGNGSDKGQLPIKTLQHLSDWNYRSEWGDCRCTPKSN